MDSEDIQELHTTQTAMPFRNGYAEISDGGILVDIADHYIDTPLSFLTTIFHAQAALSRLKHSRSLSFV